MRQKHEVLGFLGWVPQYELARDHRAEAITSVPRAPPATVATFSSGIHLDIPHPGKVDH
jgi:hypothetical protein